MKYIALSVSILFLLLLSNVCQAQQNCNPDPNTVITGVPYCSNLNMQTVTTGNPNSINNAVPKNSDTKFNSPVIINMNPLYNPYQNRNTNPNPLPLQEYITPDIPYNPNSNTYNPNYSFNSYQRNNSSSYGDLPAPTYRNSQVYKNYGNTYNGFGDTKDPQIIENYQAQNNNMNPGYVPNQNIPGSGYFKQLYSEIPNAPTNTPSLDIPNPGLDYNNESLQQYENY